MRGAGGQGHLGSAWGAGGRGSEHRDPRDSEAARRERACQMGLPPGVDPADLPFTLQRALGAIAILGCTDLLSQEHILLLARPQLQELSVGNPGPVTNKATKVGSHRGPKQWVRGHPFPQTTLLSLSFAARTGRALRTAVRASPGTCSGNTGPLPGPGTPPEPACLTAQQLCSEGISSPTWLSWCPASCRKPPLTAWMELPCASPPMSQHMGLLGSHLPAPGA